MTTATPIKKHFIGTSLQFRGLAHHSHCGKHGSMQAGMVLKRQLRVLHLDQQENSETLGQA